MHLFMQTVPQQSRTHSVWQKGYQHHARLK